MYEVCARHSHLSHAQKKNFFIHIFSGPARKFFLDNCRVEMSYHEKAEILLREYASDARQLQVKATLENLRLSAYMRVHNLKDISEGLKNSWIISTS